MNSPATLKRQAKRVHKEAGIPHTKALDILACKEGFHNYQAYLQAWERERTGELAFLREGISGLALGDSR